MAVREFNGTTDSLGLGAGAMTQWNWPSGAPCSWLILVKPLDVTSASGQAFGGVTNPGSSLGSLYQTGPFASLVWGDDLPGQDIASSGSFVFDINWWLVAFDKGAGNVTARMHAKKLGAGSWTHANTTLNIATNASVTPTAVWPLSFGSTAGAMNARIATMAVWQATRLADADYVGIESALTTASIYALSPTGLWDFNQAAVTTAVTDLTGGGGTEASRTGTTVVTTDDPPGWAFGLAAAPPDDIELLQVHSGRFGPF